MNLVLKHRSCRQNVKADALSHNPVTHPKFAENQNYVSACEESKCNVLTTGEVSKCCESVCPVCSVCSVFADVVQPDDNSDSEPIPMSHCDNEPMSSSAGVDSINTDVPCEVKDGICEVKLVID